MFKTPFLLALLVAAACGAVVTPEAPIPSPDADSESMIGPKPSPEAGGMGATGPMPSPGAGVSSETGPMPSPGVGGLGMEGPMPSPGVDVFGMESPMPSPGYDMPWESPSVEDSSAAAPDGGMEAGELEECEDSPCGDTRKPRKKKKMMMGGRKLRKRRMRKRKADGSGMGESDGEDAMPEASDEAETAESGECAEPPCKRKGKSRKRKGGNKKGSGMKDMSKDKDVIPEASDEV